MTNSSRLSALCDRIIEAGWLAAVIVVPLFFNVHSSRVFEPDKITLLRSLTLVMLAAWIIRTLEERAARRKNSDAAISLTNGVTLRTPLLRPTLILAAVYLIATLLSITPAVSFFGSYQRLQGTYTTLSYMIIFMMIVQIMRQRQQLDRLVTAIVMTSMPIAFYALLQRGDGVTTLDPLPWGGDVTARVAANMGNAIFIAAYLIMAFFLTLGRVIEAFRIILTEEESRWSDILRASAYIFVGSVQLIAFAFAESRGPLLGWLPGMFIFGLVGLILLRVSLQSARASTANGEQPAAQLDSAITRLQWIDVWVAIFVALICLAAAGITALLAYNAFPIPNVTLAAVAALIAGLVPLLVIAGIRRSAARWLWISWIMFSVIGAVGLFLINFSDHPAIVERRAAGTFGSLGTLFESEGGTGRVRTLIWEGAVKLIAPHDPLTYPDGTPDAINALRPLIGYGPEAMYVAYNRFYPPALAQIEQRNASPDRSHNETLDSWVITGAIGFAAEQLLFLSVFFFALKFIGWVPNRKAAMAYAAMMIVGGAIGALGLGLVFGVNFMGTGWPGGVTAGLVLYVILFALFHFRISKRVYILAAAMLILLVDVAIFGATFSSNNRLIEMSAATVGGALAFVILYVVGQWAFRDTAGEPIPVSGHLFLIIALFGGMLAHYLEISLAGIAIAATRTYFWTFAGILVVTGLNWVKADDVESVTEPVRAPATPEPAPSASRKKKRKALQQNYTPRPSIRRSNAGWIGPTVAMAMIGALILATIGYEFIVAPPINLPPANSALELIGRSFTMLPQQDNRYSPGVMLLFLVTWLFGAVVSLTELRRRDVIKAGNQLQAVVTYLGLSIAVAAAYWLVHASAMLYALELAKVGPGQTINETITHLLAPAEGFAGLLGWFYLFVFGTIFVMAWSLLGRARPLAYVNPLAGVGGAPIFLAATLLLVGVNFNPIRADVVFKQSQVYIGGNVCNAPGGGCDIAIAHLKQALRLAPLEDFYMLTLGAGYLNKSSAADPSAPDLLLDSSTYTSVFNLDAQTTRNLSRHDLLIAARTTLSHAQEVNPLNTDHSANLARMHRSWSDLAGSDAERLELLQRSSEYYAQATLLSPNNAQLWNEWAVVFLSIAETAKRGGDSATDEGSLTEAQARLDQSISLDPDFADTYRWLGSLYRAKGEDDKAVEAWRQALSINPAHFESWALLTEYFVGSNQLDQAEQLTLDYLAVDANNLPALRTLSRNVYFQQGRVGEAITYAQHAVDVGQNDPQHWEDELTLAEMLRVSGNLAEALPHAQAAVQLAPPERAAEAQSVLDAIQAALQQGTPSP